MNFANRDQVAVICRSAAERAALVGTPAATGLIFYVPTLTFQRYDDSLGEWVSFGTPGGWTGSVAVAASIDTDDTYSGKVLQVDGTGAARTITLHEPGWAGFTLAVRRTNSGGSNVIIAADDIDGATTVTLTGVGMRALMWDGSIWTVVGSA